MVERNKTKEVEVNNCKLEVTYDHYYDAGCHTLPNGDPGYPPSGELAITSIRMIEGELMTLISDELFETIEQKLND